MRYLNLTDIVKLPYSKEAIIRKDFPGFKEDYLVLHCLIRKYKPKTFMEIGTSTGKGTKVICNAMKSKHFRNDEDIKVFSIDVPPGTDPKILYPNGEDGHPKCAGKKCNLPYTQIFGNTYNFDFTPYYPLEGWYIDGKHSYEFVKNDTKLAIKCEPIIIIWHDMDITGVTEAVTEVMEQYNNYNLYRVINTRIAFAVNKKYEI